MLILCRASDRTRPHGHRRFSPLAARRVSSLLSLSKITSWLLLRCWWGSRSGVEGSYSSSASASVSVSVSGSGSSSALTYWLLPLTMMPRSTSFHGFQGDGLSLWSGSGESFRVMGSGADWCFHAFVEAIRVSRVVRLEVRVREC